MREPLVPAAMFARGRFGYATGMTIDDGQPGEGTAPQTAPEGTPASGFPEPPGKDPGDRSLDPAPHHALSNPLAEPDPTEWPDPYEEREDPREPVEGMPFGPERHPATGTTSTSEPHPDIDLEAPDSNPPQRDRLDQ